MRTNVCDPFLPALLLCGTSLLPRLLSPWCLHREALPADRHCGADDWYQTWVQPPGQRLFRARLPGHSSCSSPGCVSTRRGWGGTSAQRAGAPAASLLENAFAPLQLALRRAQYWGGGVLPRDATHMLPCAVLFPSAHPAGPQTPSTRQPLFLAT